MRLRLSAAARRDLAGIWDYSVKRWSEAQADRYVGLFKQSFDRLSLGTLKGRCVDDIRAGYFNLDVESHLVFYRIHSAGEIEVVRILNQRMDVNRHLGIGVSATLVARAHRFPSKAGRSNRIPCSLNDTGRPRLAGHRP